MAGERKKKNMGKVVCIGIETFIEKFLWSFRLVVVLGVICMLVGSAMLMLLGIAETIELCKLFFGAVIDHGTHISKIVYAQLIVGTITVVDDFLLGIVLLIFGLGSYDLFISKIDKASDDEDTRPGWLVFNSLDELKEVLGKVVLMIIIIHFLQFVVNFLNVPKEELQSISILYLGGSIAFIALALRWSHGNKRNDPFTKTIEVR